MTETKISLLGKVSTFECREVFRGRDQLVLLYVLEAPRMLHGLALAAGTLTLATYWPSRPYNAYHFLTPDGLDLAFYFNLSDATEIGSDWVSWRDLMVDVLLMPGQPARMLDVEELPDTLDPDLRTRMEREARALLTHAPEVAAELEQENARHYRRLFQDPEGLRS